MVLGIGNAGGNIVESVIRKTDRPRQKEVLYFLVDCNESDLIKHKVNPSQLILLDEEKDEFHNANFEAIDELIIVTGLGGKTGSKFTELAAVSAKKAGVEKIIIIATLPFLFEGENRRERSFSVAKRLQELPGISLLCFDNEKIREKYPDIGFFNAFDTIDKEIMGLIEQVIENPAIPSSKILASSNPENIPAEAKLYVFSTYSRFKSEIREKLEVLKSDVSSIELYLLNCAKDIDPTFMSRALVLQYHSHVNIIIVGDSFMPPEIKEQDIIVDATTLDSELQPLRGGYKSLEQYISKQRATIYKVLCLFELGPGYKIIYE